MSRAKKIVEQTDGTPVETDEDIPAPVVDPNKNIRTRTPRTVIWTKEGEENHAFSEHGQHKEGETVSTIYADVFVKRGHAKEVH